MSPRILIVIPTLNEESHIGVLLDQLLPEAEALDARIIVADGGSVDGTVDIVGKRSEPRIVLLHNPRRIQSAAINLAVQEFGDGADYLIRIDAHGTYPADYCRQLVAEAEARRVASVVVPMTTLGQAGFQRAVATAQNSPIGTGGSAHRSGSERGPVDHGHHALMRIDAFRDAGGYDESFRANEDAELDFRLRAAGHTIWLTDRTSMIYYPRATMAGLFRQYFGYGGGRARNILKHRMRPRLRQLVPLAILPVVLLAALSLWHWAYLIPLLFWGLGCIALGAHAAARHAPNSGPLWLSPLVGWAAMIMHFAWSSGFWLALLERPFQRRST